MSEIAATINEFRSRHLSELTEKERYMVTYNPTKGNIFALLKDQAKSDDILKAAFHAHVPTTANIEAHILESYKMVSVLYGPFNSKATEQGWMMSESPLNPARARLCEVVD